MEKIELKRVFEFTRNNKKLMLADPDPTLMPSKVAIFYSNIYPEMINASVNGPNYTDNGEAVYKISATIGTKG